MMGLFRGEGTTIKASQGGNTNPAIDIPRYINLYNSGAFFIDEMITHTFTLDEINDGFNILRSGKAGRVMIQIKG
jgi:Zn-dependent alcohol dehydrogenase